MPGRTTYEAWENYIRPLNKALLCMDLQQGFTLTELAEGLQVNTRYAVTLNDMESVPLMLSRKAPKHQAPLQLVAGQNIKFYESDAGTAQERFRVRTLSYLYGFTTDIGEASDVEVLAFHWRRESGTEPGSRGHLHVGPALMAHQQIVRPLSFHKAHIPTGRLSFEAIVRFAIEELKSVSGKGVE